MAEGGEDIEMGEHNDGMEDEDEEGTGETSFTDGDQRRRLDDLTGRHTFGTDDITRVADGKAIPRAGRDAGVIKKSITDDKKQIFKDELGVAVNVRDGNASKSLIVWTRFVFDKNGRVNGAWFKDEKVMVYKKGGGVRYSENSREKTVRAVKNFKELIEKAKTEHSKTLPGAVEEANNDPTTSQKVVTDVISQVIPESERILEEREEDLQEKARGILLTEQEIGEFSGTLDPKGTDTERIEALDAQADYYMLKALRESDPTKEQFYKSVMETAELKADSIRFKIGERPEHREAVSILTNEVENNDLNRLEKFKKWAKENMVGLSAIAITIAGLITTVVVAARKTVSGGAKAVGGFAKALANLAKKVGPLLAPLLNLVAQVLTWGVKGISWLAKNLWVLAMFMTWLLYDYWT